MSKYIAEQTVKHLIKNDKKIKGANVLVMGVTFKEDCPDTRNTKVIDVRATCRFPKTPHNLS